MDGTELRYLSIAAATCKIPTFEQLAIWEALHSRKCPDALRDHIAGRLAASHALEHSARLGQSKHVAIFNDSQGAPHFQNHAELLSIAHREGLGLAAVSAHVISGIDIETWDAFDSIPLCSWGYEERYFAQMSEYQKKPQAKIKCAVWTSTEALAKSLGTGLVARAGTLKVAELNIRPWGWQASFKHYPAATAYVWPCHQYLVGLVIHQFKLNNPARIGNKLNTLLCAAVE